VIGERSELLSRRGHKRDQLGLERIRQTGLGARRANQCVGAKLIRLFALLSRAPGEKQSDKKSGPCKLER
jgi:hypothetical protein